MPAALAPFVRPLLPGLDLSVLDLGGQAPTAVREWEASPAVKLTLAFMRAVVDDQADLVELLAAFADDLVALMARPGGPDVFRVVLRYSIRRRTDVDVAALAARAAELAGRKAGETVKSTWDQLIEQGELKNARTTLIRLVAAKFGSVPPEVQPQVDAASLDDLARWTQNVLTARRVEDVFVTS